MEAVPFFGFIQSRYNFFSASTHHWKILTSQFGTCNECLTLKSLPTTRWSARADATKASQLGYKAIQDALTEIFVDNGNTGASQHKACQLRAALASLETAVMPVVWDVILQQVQIDLCSFPISYDSHLGFIGQVRNDFLTYETESKILLDTEVYKSRLTTE